MAPTTSTQEPADVPVPGSVFSVLLSFASITALTLFLTQRVLAIKNWGRLPFVVWLVFAIYADSYLFVLAISILQYTLGVNSSYAVCESAIILCLLFYVTTKLIYLFLVEKAYSIRGGSKPRLRSRLYIFNSFGMLGVYVVVVILNFIFRITEMKDGVCIIGMRSVAMIPLISFDAVVNVYLTILFLIPFKNLYSFKHMPRTKANVRLRMVAMRTFVGSLCTTTSSVVNLAVLSSLKGEPGWVCLMCCNADILFSAMVIQWVTSRDNAGTVGSNSSSPDGKTHRSFVPGQARSVNHDELRMTPPSTVTDISLVASMTRCHADDTGDSAKDFEEAFESVTRSPKAATSVVVTTTIKHESEPRETDLERLPRMPRQPQRVRSQYGGGGGGGGGGVDSMSLIRPTNGLGRYMTSQTMVTGGSAP